MFAGSCVFPRVLIWVSLKIQSWCRYLKNRGRLATDLEGEMGHHHDHGHHHHHHHHERDGPYDDPFLACCCCPCYLVVSLFRGIGRCFFVACYPILQCFGLDECRHHHHHSHFH